MYPAPKKQVEEKMPQEENKKDICIKELCKKFGVDPEKQKKDTVEFMKEYYNETWKIRLRDSLEGIEEAMQVYNMSFEEVAAETVLRELIKNARKDAAEKFKKKMKKKLFSKREIEQHNWFRLLFYGGGRFSQCGRCTCSEVCPGGLPPRARAIAQRNGRWAHLDKHAMREVEYIQVVTDAEHG